MKNRIKRLLFIPVFLMSFLSISQTEDYKIWEENFNLGYQYFNSNQFTLAETHFGKALEASKTAFIESAEEPITTLYFYANCKYVLSNYNEALQLFKDVLSKAQNLPQRNIDFEIRVWGEISSIFSSKGDSIKAISEQVKLNKFIEEQKGINTDLYAANLNNLGQMYFAFGDSNEALRHYKKARDIFLELGLRTVNFATVYNNLGLCYFTFGSYLESDKAYYEAFNIAQELQIENTQFYSKLLSNISSLSLVQGDYDNAKILQERSLKLLAALNLNNTIDFADGLFLYGQLLKELGQFDDAIDEVKKSQNLYNRHLPKDHLKFANVYNILGELFLNNGNTKLASENYNAAYNLLEKTGSQTITAYGYTLLGLGYLNQALGDYDKSLEYYISGANHLKDNFSEKHKDYGIALMNIGEIYRAKEDYQKAYAFLETAIDIIADSIGTDNTTYGQLCVMILQVAYSNPDETLTELEFLADFAINIFGSKENKNNLFYNYAHFYKAIAKMENKQYQEAIDLFLTIEKEIIKDVDESSQLHNNVISLIALCYDKINDFDKAFTYYKKANSTILQSLNEIFSFRSEKDKKNYLKTIEYWFSNVTSISLKEGFVCSDLTSISLNNQLLRKGLLLNSSKDILSQLKTLNNPEIDAKIKEYKSLKDLIIYMELIPEIQDLTELKSVENDVNRFETELVEIYNDNFSTVSDFNKDWKKIRASLKQNEIAIEFVSYLSSESQSSNYIAYIIKNNSEYPEVVKLFNENNLKEILSKKTPNQLYATRGSKGKNVTVSKDMYKVIWNPLEQYVGNAETIYFSPVGLLNQIPFAALSAKGDELLSTKHNLVQLSSTSLLSDNFSEPRSENILFVGGIDYEFTPSGEVKKEKFSDFEILKKSKGTRGLGTGWNYLPGTLNEVKALESIFKQNNKSYTSLTQKTATEENIKALSRISPDILHIATHGFFFENLPKEEHNQMDWSPESVYKISEDPLMRSGIILAGANYAWQKGSNPYRVENGILTALEISNLDLSNTDMVVLSACETGLGDIDGSEGVYGLQRAFKMAGVDIIVMSLWEVPDIETAEFMNSFYNNWLGGMKIREAFNKTQRTMSNKYKGNPEKWAAFVLFE